MDKDPAAFRTISEVAQQLDVPQHVLRFWETRFTQIKPLKRGGGRRYYRPDDVELLKSIRHLLYGEGYTIRGVQRVLKEQGPRGVTERARSGPAEAASIRDGPDASETEAIGPSPPGLDLAPEHRAHAVPASELPAADPAAVMPRANAGAPISNENLDRLRTVLFEITECERLLLAARAL
jgi:DNA-binding transcriptional MerR regulator